MSSECRSILVLSLAFCNSFGKANYCVFDFFGGLTCTDVFYRITHSVILLSCYACCKISYEVSHSQVDFTNSGTRSVASRGKGTRIPSDGPELEYQTLHC